MTVENLDDEPRRARVFLLDTSGSGPSERHERLKKGLIRFEDVYRVDIEVLAFDSDPKLVCDFVAVANFEPLVLTAKGGTFPGTSVLGALDRIAQRKAHYERQGLPFHRPWLFLLADGQTSDTLEDLQSVKQRLYKKARASLRGRVCAAWGTVSVYPPLDIDGVASAE